MGAYVNKSKCGHFDSVCGCVVVCVCVVIWFAFKEYEVESVKTCIHLQSSFLKLT